MNPTQRKQLAYLISLLQTHEPRYVSVDLPHEPVALWGLFRRLVNIRHPKPLPPGFVQTQDELLSSLIEDRGITDYRTLKPLMSWRDRRIFLWRGDITLLKVDAIVNAGNRELLGCFQPGHHCIDNAIHTYAGAQLRLACHELMTEQGHPEPTGQAKVTPAFNLPSELVIHTVGPIVGDEYPSPHEERELQSSYESCLQAADRTGCHSISLCCVSTGVFGYPIKPATEVALQAVKRFLPHAERVRDVIFCVFSERDEAVYREVIRTSQNPVAR